jgi:hypothetical protein
MYDVRSAEALLGEWCEREVAQRAMRLGWHVLHTSTVGEGATMVTGPDGQKVVMPDIQLFDLIKGRRSRLVEVKAKAGAYFYGKLRINCTGTDYRKFEAYRRINDGGVPVDLAIVHLHWPLRSSPEIAPKLLWQTVEMLDEGGMMLFDDPHFRGGAAVWNVKQFDLLGDLPNPPSHIIEALQSIKRHLRVWETNAPRLRRPRKVPGQMEMDV